MSELIALRCDACGGAVAMPAGKTSPTCLFCGASDLSAADLPQDDQPQGWLDFAVSAEDASASFAEFTTSSFWYPGDLKSSQAQLKRLFLPAWSWSGHLETHWAGIKRSHKTDSGKKPKDGQAQQSFGGVLVPSSSVVYQRELTAIAPFEGEEQPLESVYELLYPYELGDLTRSVARQGAVREMERLHAFEIKTSEELLEVNTSSVATELQGRSLLLPVWIGAYRYKDKSYRVVVNARSGKITAEAPISWIKVGLVVASVLGVIGAIVAVVAGQ